MRAFVELIPILDDNYIFMIRNHEDQNLIVVDPGDSKPCKDYIDSNQLKLTSILLTHHHPDHIGGVLDLKLNHPDLLICAPEKNQLQIPWASRYVKNGDQIQIGTFNFEITELPGHTLGICGYYEREQQWLFSGDVIFGLGCGRLFEGTADMLFESLKKIKSLPPQTTIYCTHEYTTTNMRFVESLIEQEMIPKGFNHQHFAHYSEEIRNRCNDKKPTAALNLKTELMCNPFLLAETAEQLGELRRLRNQFK